MIILEEDDWSKEYSYSSMMPRYISNESAYSIMSRFALRNAINPTKLVKLFASKVNSNRVKATKNLSCLYSIDLINTEKHLRLTKAELYSLFLVPEFVADIDCIEENLKYCRHCLSQHRHYALFQLVFVHDCPLHRVPLIQRCPNCGAGISNRLEAATFKVPFGCPCCNQTFIARAPSKQVFVRVNKDGELLLEAFAYMLKRKADHAIVFSFQRQTSIYCDNVLCLSKSLENALATERTFFYWLIRNATEEHQGWSLDVYPRQTSNRYKIVSKNASLGDEVALTDYFFATFKSLSRYVVRLLQAKKCLGAVCKTLWRDPVGGEIPHVCPQILALIAWRTFWLNARTPIGTLQAERGNHCKIREWLQSILYERSVSLFPVTQRLWLIQHIFAHALNTTLEAFLAAFTTRADFPAPTEWPTNPLSSSNCWAVYIDNEGASSITTFVPGPHKNFLSSLGDHLPSLGCDCVED
ncbi:hypothetical protein PMI23_04539 [Pseudomonas sp. GM24]|nr:hypothetical protein PMI19_04146 [Pseudomonas sp. GM16]EJM31075.1 hypothetical protein PMI23_04539 [Pseudomonas sp. GM24]